MKLRIVSDLHLDHDNIMLPYVDDEYDQTLILAGDITDSYKLMDEFLLDCSNRFKYIILIYGNHEFYGKEVYEAKRIYKAMAEKHNIHLLDNEFLTLDDITFFGGTLWTSSYFVKNTNFTDFTCIKYPEQFHYFQYLEFMNTLVEKVESVDVVISHHSPSYKSLDIAFINSPFNKYFMNDLDCVISMWNNVKYWIHGHTHKNNEYKIGECNVLCNPKGYGDENKEYNPLLLVEVNK